MQHIFGSGAVWGTPLTDANGNTISNPTPVLIGVMQDISVDISFDTKMLYGQNQFPVALGRGKGKISCKAKFGQINGQLLNSLVFGQTLLTGAVLDYRDITGTAVPASTPFTITPTPPGSSTWSRDLGVVDQNGLPMTAVASGPTTGQYSVAAGVYTFAAADEGKQVFISYQYTMTSTTAKQSTIMNVAMGAAPTFRCDLLHSFSNKGLSLSLYNCLSSKLSLASKQDDFAIPEMDFDAFADSLGRVGLWSTAE